MFSIAIVDDKTFEYPYEDKHYKQIKLNFNSVDERIAYVKKERAFCTNEEINFDSCRSTQARNKARLLVFAKRKQFAISQGFKQKKGEEWERNFVTNEQDYVA